MLCSRFSVLGISALVLLAACASGPAAQHKAGHSASSTAANTASAAATASPTASASLTTVQIGRYTQEFAGSVPTDPAQASVIGGFRQAEVLWNKSLQAWHLDTAARQFVIGGARSHLNAAIANDKQHGIVVAGIDEFFMTKITSLGANSATVTTCDNDSKITGVQKATGQIDNFYAPSPDQAYLLEKWNMVRHSGHWAISSFVFILLPDPRAQSCQP